MKTDKYMNIKPFKKKLKWETDKDGEVMLEIENRGILKKVLGFPEVSTVSFDKLGSFVWQEIDGIKDIKKIGRSMEERFGKEASPIYERLLKYLKILKSYNFIGFKA